MVGQQRGHSPRLSVPSVVLCAMIRKLPPALFSRAKGHSGKGPGVFHLVAAPKVPWSSCLVCTLISQGIAWLLTFIQLSGDPQSFHTVPNSTKQLQGKKAQTWVDGRDYDGCSVVGSFQNPFSSQCRVITSTSTFPSQGVALIS